MVIMASFLKSWVGRNECGYPMVGASCEYKSAIVGEIYICIPALLKW